MGDWLQFGRGEVGWERRRRRNRRKRVGVWGGYIMVFFDGITDGDSIGDSATLLYGYLSLNPSVIPSVKLSEKTQCHHAIASFQTNYILHRRKRSVYTDKNIPSVYTDRFSDGSRPSVYTDRFWDGIISVGNYTNEICSSVIPLVFSGFLVVY